MKQKAKDKWEETKEAARKGHTDLANQYTQETDAIVKTLKELDSQLEDTTYDKDKASLELNKYKLGIYQGTIQKEELDVTPDILVYTILRSMLKAREQEGLP